MGLENNLISLDKKRITIREQFKKCLSVSKFRGASPFLAFLQTSYIILSKTFNLTKAHHIELQNDILSLYT